MNNMAHVSFEDLKQDANPPLQIIQGTFVHATDDDPMVVLKDALVVVMGTKIEFIGTTKDLNFVMDEYNVDELCIHRMTSNQFMIPGFVDTHIHASQFPNNGLALDLPLLEWLQKYTFPTEAQFSDVATAREIYTRVVDRVLQNGTTTAAYYATLHVAASRVLADVVCVSGQRALIGKVNMVRNCPDWYTEASVADSVRHTEEFIQCIRGIQSPLVQPIITPRFALTCPKELLDQLGELASKYKCPVQTHISETQAEVDFVKELYPSAKSYAHVYDEANLLGEQTILAHGIWLTNEEIDLINERGAGISHCPNSNLSIRSGVCDVRRLLSRGVNVGLGSDCSAGYNPSMLDAIRHAVQSSNVLSITHGSEYENINVKDAFKMATLGGAKVMNLGDKIGNFEVGKDFDALLIDVNAAGTPFDIFKSDSLENKIQKFFFLGDDRNIKRIYVAGKRLK